MPLTPRQKLFVAAYAGNSAEAARRAGYSEAGANVTGSKLLANPNIAAAIASRQKSATAKRILSREERQEFWTKVVEDTGAEMRDRLKASELLGKSEADFIDKVELGVSATLEQVLSQALVGK